MRKSTVLTIGMAFLTILVIAGGFTSFQRKRSTFERLDFRFHWVSGTILVDEVSSGSGADQAGIQPGDRILVVGGTPTTEVDGLKRTLRRVGPVDLVIARGNETLVVPYSAPGLKIDYHYLFLSFIGFLYLAIGLFTYMRSREPESTLFFALTLLTFVVYVYTPAGNTDITFKSLYFMEEFARIFLPPLGLHFFLRFPQPLIRHRGILAALYALPALLALWTIDLLVLGNAIAITTPARAFLLIDRWEMLHFAIYFTLAFIALTYTYRTAAATPHKKQIQWIYLGVGAGFIPFLTLYLIPFVLKGAGSAYTTAAIIPLALIPLAFAVSILKYKLWDVEVVIKEVLAYTVTFVFGMIAFSTINLFLSMVLEEHLVMERNFLAFASGLLIAGVLVPLKSRIETLVEMIVYRDTYRHRQAMSDFIYELATFHDLNDLLESIRQRLAAAIEIQRMNLYFREGDSFRLYSPELGLPEEVHASDFDGRLAKGYIALDEPRVVPSGSAIPVSLMQKGYRYVFPLLHRNLLEGMLICGSKRGEAKLSRDDLQLISNLTAPVALAIENARLYGRLRRQLAEIGSLKDFNENIIESSSSGIAVVDGDGTLLTANHAFWELIGREPDNTLSAADLFPPFQDLRQSPGATVETPFVNQRGEKKHLSLTASPFMPSTEAVGNTDKALVLVITDISDRVRLESELQEKERLAALGLLAAGVAHEVNTPLTGISSYAQILLGDISEDDPHYPLLKKMEQQTFRASHIVNNLLDFAANRRREAEPVALHEVVSATVALQEDSMRAKAVQVHVSYQPEIWTSGNFYELQQVLTNLLLNARDAVARGGNVWIEVGREGEEAVLRVRDDGRGIPVEMQKEIFRPLVTGKAGQGGTGLGLAVSDRIVRGLGGRIVVQSEPGHGSEFSVMLPLLVRQPDTAER